MNVKTIANLYSKINDLEAGARIVNFDLHIHSPASKDFSAVPDRTNKDLYYSILDEAIAKDIGIIAITDHNTFYGYNQIAEYLRADKIARRKYKSLLILCGIEISCYSNHILAIFDCGFSADKQNQFLFEIGIDKESQGTEEALADELGPSALLGKISDYGGITLLAHADAEKGFLFSYVNKKDSDITFKGKSLEKIVKSPYIYGIQIVSDYGEARIKQVLSNKNYRRDDRVLPYLFFSDAHGIVVDGQYTGTSGKHIGAVVSKAKLSHKSFSALKMALSDTETRIVKTERKAEYPTIIGCAIKSDIIKSNDFDFACFRFSDQLNCIIGSRGTGKSTLLGIIRDVLEYDIAKSAYNDRYSTAVVFIRIENQIYAISNDRAGRHYRNIFVKNRNSNTFTVYKQSANFLNLFLTKSYNQGELYDYHLKPRRVLEIIDNFVMWKHYEKYGDNIQIITQTTEEVRQLFDLCIKHDKNLIEYMKDQELDGEYLQKYYEIQNAKNDIVKMRDEFAAKINKILANKLNMRITYEMDEMTNSFLTEQFPNDVAKKAWRFFDYEVEVQRFITSIIEKSKLRSSLDFFTLLITNQDEKVFEEYIIEKTKRTQSILNDIRRAMKPAELLLYLDNGVHLEYNVNSGMPKAKAIFRESRKLSLGQNAVALLLIILTAAQDLNDNRPLLMDQPEDDLDNSYIFNTLVEEFRRSKCNRQLIISTHNANIPVAADAENIVVLQYNGDYGFMENNGSLDNPKISESVLDILEGGELALRNRNEKYRTNTKIIM